MYSCVHVYLLFLLFLLILLQAISHPSSDAHQDKAWQKVCPLVLRLRSYYEYAQELETVLNEILNTICSPEMTALEHLEKQQVGHSVHTLYMYYCTCTCIMYYLHVLLCHVLLFIICVQYAHKVIHLVVFVCLLVCLCNQKKKNICGSSIFAKKVHTALINFIHVCHQRCLLDLLSRTESTISFHIVVILGSSGFIMIKNPCLVYRLLDPLSGSTHDCSAKLFVWCYPLSAKRTHGTVELWLVDTGYC